MKLYSLLKRSRVASALGETYNLVAPRSAVAVLGPPRASANGSLFLNNVHTNLWDVITHRLRSAPIETNGTRGEFILFAVALVIEKIISSLRANKTPFNATPFISTTFLFVIVIIYYKSSICSITCHLGIEIVSLQLGIYIFKKYLFSSILSSAIRKAGWYIIVLHRFVTRDSKLKFKKIRLLRQQIIIMTAHIFSRDLSWLFLNNP